MKATLQLLVAALLLAPLASVAADGIQPRDLLKDPDGTEFRFSYFPTLNKLRLLVLKPPVNFTRWEAVLAAAGKRRELLRHDGALPFPPVGVTLDTPLLAAGKYELTVTLTGADGTRREIKRRFERQRFEWENAKLGRDRVVIPPFTPLEVNDANTSVACVLRQHDLDGVGLWKQVTSQQRALLAAPMRLEVESDGATHLAAGRRVSFAEKSPDRVRGATTLWTAGPVRGRTEFEWDYDGLMKVTLRLEPTPRRVDALRLVIPLKSSEAWLMHPVTDLLRFHYAGRIPNGKGSLWDYSGTMSEVRYTETGEPEANGKVWDSSHVGRHQLPGPFVPYIWLGGPERGICWFAENDRDWSLAADKPALEIRKHAGTTSLIVHFINQPTALTRARTIVFGLMATPAKPMPETPVNWRRWQTGAPSAQMRDVAAIGFMGACYYWGAAGPCYAFYEAFRDFSVYDEYARLRQGGKPDPTFVDRWLARFSAPEFQPNMGTYRAHINWSIRLFSDAVWREAPASKRRSFVIPYTNARAINWGDEARTFLDEWSNVDIADPRWPGEERFVRTPDGGYVLAAYGKVVPANELAGIAYAVDPVPSWQDHALHYHKRMLETFADGIYFDDYFLSPNYNPLGPGYIDDTGKLHSGVNLFAFHDLAKRIAVMQHRLGRRPQVFIHMTNANIVPMLSFATLLLDHEWRDRGPFEAQDCHDRLGLDSDTALLLTQSTGLQAGAVGVLHDLFRRDPPHQRSALGVALTHELRFGLWSSPLTQQCQEQLLNFGYGQADCRVWRYWDDDQPLTLTGAPAKSLLLARGGEALLVVCSYGPGGDVTLRLDAAKLGLTADVTAVNAESGETIERVASSGYRLPLPKHDFRLIHVRKR